MMRVTTLKTWRGDTGGMTAYYAGLARDQQQRDGTGRGPVDYYLDPNEPPGRWWGRGCAASGWGATCRPRRWSPCSRPAIPRPAGSSAEGSG